MSFRSTIRSAAAFLALLLPSSIGPADLSAQAFGTSVAVVGDEVAFGEPDSFLRPGTVYLYRGFGDARAVADTLRAVDGMIGDGFGTSVAAAGDRLIVGAPGADGGRGAAYVFAVSE